MGEVYNERFKQFVTGQVAVSESLTQLPDVPAKYVWFEYDPASTSESTLSLCGSADDEITDGYVLGELNNALGPIPMENLNQLYAIASTTGVVLRYLIGR